MTDDPLAYWLDRWASWMRWNMGELPEAYPRIASGFQDARTNWMVSETDGDDFWDTHVVPDIVRAIDAAIDSLGEREKRCVWWRYGLTRVEPTAAPVVYGQALERVRTLVLKRVAIA